MKTLKNNPFAVVMLICTILSCVVSYKFKSDNMQMHADELLHKQKLWEQKIELEKILEENNNLVLQRDSAVKERDAIKADIKYIKDNYSKFYKLYVQIKTHNDSTQFAITEKLLSKHRKLARQPELERNKPTIK